MFKLRTALLECQEHLAGLAQECFPALAAPSGMDLAQPELVQRPELERREHVSSSVFPMAQAVSLLTRP